MAQLFLLTLVGISLLQLGYGLQCYVSQQCAPDAAGCAPQLTTCPNGSSHCSTLSYKMKPPGMSMDVPVTQKACVQSAAQTHMCNKQTMCKSVVDNMNGTDCDVSCCTGDGCNKVTGGPTQSPGNNSTGSTPGPFSCYMCSTEQNPNACDNPVLQACPVLAPGMALNACYNMTTTMSMNNQTRTMKASNCTHASIPCEKVCEDFNKMNGTVCKVNCCGSSGCNGEAIVLSKTTEKPTVKAGAQTGYQPVQVALAILFNLILVTLLAM